MAQGWTSALIANEILESNKRFHLFDSFEGLPKLSEKDRLKDYIFSIGSIDSYTGAMSSYRENVVRSRLEAVSFPAR